jgi:hypothetical protein
MQVETAIDESDVGRITEGIDLVNEHKSTDLEKRFH